MSEMKDIREAYPEEDGYLSFYDYDPLLASMGYEILLKVDDDDYQGDSRLLLRDGERFGILIFGWGSCSGCDSLQRCSSYEEVEKLRHELHDDIKWGSLVETLTYFNEHDWEGDYSYHSEKTQAFIEQAVAMLQAK